MKFLKKNHSSDPTISIKKYIKVYHIKNTERLYTNAESPSTTLNFYTAQYRNI